MRTITTILKTTALAISGAIVLGLPFFNTAKKYVPRNEQLQMLNNSFGGAAEYYHRLKMDPSTGKLNPDAMTAFSLSKLQEYMAAQVSHSNVVPVMDLAWSEMGPDNVGGRCRAILIDKNNHSRMYAGAVSGGLFVSTNSGNSWSPIDDQQPTLTVSCITQDNAGNIYFGTGEGMARGGNGDGNSAFPGLGVFKMTYNSGSDSYSAPAPLTATQPVANGAFNKWSFINRIKCSPILNGNGTYNLYVATYDGLWMSTDGGTTFVDAVPAYNFFAMDVDVANDGAVYATLGGPGTSSNRVYYSAPANNGAAGTYVNVTPPTTTNFPYSSFGRTEVAVYPSNSQIVYISIAKPYNAANSYTSTLTVVYQSLDGGTTWSNIGSGNANFLPFNTYGQGDYDHVLEVFPDNPYSILLGGVDMFRWDAVSTSIPSVGQWTGVSSSFQNPFNPTYCHADKHAITFDPLDPNTFYIGSDGGVSRTTNRGIFYTDMNQGFNVTQFYAVAYEKDALWSFGPNTNQFNGAGAFGGAQDNGTQYISGNNNTVRSAVEINGGDGYYAEASMLSPNTFFYTSYYGLLERSAAKDGNGADFYPERAMINCSATTLPGDGAFGPFITPISMWESGNMTNSVDSVLFVVDSIKIPGAVVCNGTTARYKITIPKPQLSTIINGGTLVITAGNQVVTCTGGVGQNLIGSVNGSGVNTFYPTGDSLDVTFATTPAVNTPIKIVTAVSYAQGSQINVSSNSFTTKFGYTITQTGGLVTGDSIMVQDVIQSRVAVGLNGTIMMCKNPLNFSAVPHWVKIASGNSVNSLGTTAGFSGYVQTLEFAGANHMYFANQVGDVFRISGLASVANDFDGDVDSVLLAVAGGDSAWTCSKNKTSPLICEKIASFAKTVTSISPDPTNPDRLIVTLGNYGSTNHVYYCSSATSVPASATTSNFTVIGTVNYPVYSSTFVQTTNGQANPNNVLIGSEDGVYSIDLSNTGAGWQSEKDNSSGKFPNVPTFMLRQQTLGNWECNNSGIIYAGTHGRGIWQSQKYFSPLQVGVNEIQAGNKGLAKLVKVFPNPANDNTTVNFTLGLDKKVSVVVYDLKGAVIKTLNLGKLNKGTQNINVSLDGISEGTYIIAVSGDNELLGSCRFVKISN